MKRAIIVSFVVHLALLAMLVWELPRRPSEIRSGENTMIVEIRGRPNAAGDGTRATRRPHAKIPSLSSLRLGLVPRATPASGASEGRHAAGQIAGDGFDEARGMTLEEESRRYPFHEAIWRRVDSLITYPDDFVQQRLEGTVTIQLAIDRRGVFSGDLRSIRGSQPLLNAFVLATVIHALRTPLPQPAWSKEAPETSLLVLQFDFATFGPGGHPHAEEYAHFKNLLAFRRDAYVDPALNQLVERIFTRYLPPLIPLPGGGVFLDFPRAFTFFKNLVTDAPDELDRREKRLRLDLEKWESVIRESRAPAPSPN